MVTVALACGGDGDAEKGGEIWRSLPEMPGATLIAQGNEPVRDGDEVVGYIVRVNYHVPDETTVDDVMAFYIEALDGEWSHCESNANDVSIPG